MKGDAIQEQHRRTVDGAIFAPHRIGDGREAQALDEDLPPLADALHHAGVEAHIVPWDAVQDWSQFDMLLLRSTWDYMSRLEEFLSWAGTRRPRHGAS